MHSRIFVPATPPVAIPLHEILPWFAFVSILALIAIYFVAAEQGAFAFISGNFVHEFLHDGRHLLAFPCH
jgi:hypothetical protein